MLIKIILASLVVSLISLLGILILFKKQNKASFLKGIISLAAGALLGVTFFELLPEAVETDLFEPHLIFMVVLISILFFFLLERIFHWHHCRCEEHGEPSSNDKSDIIVINLIGDSIHNFVDGALIASAFLLDAHSGILVTAAVILHEIPQEISDFGVLLYAGLSKKKAIIYNLISALVAVVGALVFYFFGNFIEGFIPLAIAFAAGNFIYLSTADLIPELHHESEQKNIFYHSIWLLVGVAIVYLGGQIIPHGH